MIRRLPVPAVVVGLLAGSMVVAAPAGAVHSSTWFSRSTIFVQNMTPTNPWSAYLNDRVAYYRTVGWRGSNGPANPQIGTCRAGYPCVKVYISDFGATSWAGLEWDGNGAKYCRSAHYNHICNYPRAASSIKINTHYLYNGTVARSTFCHELGHAWGLSHEDGPTCMQPVTGTYTGIDYSEVVNDLNVMYRNVPD
jgi:hypothetical protein